MNFKDYNQSQLFLFPPTFGDLIPESHPVRVVNEVIEKIKLEPLLKAQANVILIGTGKTQQFPSAAIWQKLVANGVGFEVMTTDSACRTYNVLLGDARKVAAAFFFD